MTELLGLIDTCLVSGARLVLAPELHQDLAQMQIGVAFVSVSVP
jgi:hypothetical protein